MSRHNIRQRVERRATINRFAEALADGMTVREASARAGCSVSAGRNHLIAIKAALGVEQCA